MIVSNNAMGVARGTHECGVLSGDAQATVNNVTDIAFTNLIEV